MPRSGGGSGAGLDSYGVTILRVTLGLIFVMHAYAAVGLTGTKAMAAELAGFGVPSPLLAAWCVILANGVGGALIVLGVFTRWAALANLPVMAGAFFLVHLKQGFFMGKDGGYEFILLVLAANLAQVFLGPGALALRR